jgi:hypothetical protein
MALMKSWVDRTSEQNNVWLVLVFHGVDGIGWKPITAAQLRDYFGYINSKTGSLWVATFQDVGKYIRERRHATVSSFQDGNTISIVLRSDLSDLSYDLPLTLKTAIPKTWSEVAVQQGDRTTHIAVVETKNDHYALYQAVPNGEVVTLSEFTGK